MGLRVMSFALALPPQTQTGNSGGQVQAVDQRRNLFFTSRSSSEWNVMTHSRPPGARCSKMVSSPSSRASSSWLTAMRSAWNVRREGFLFLRRYAGGMALATISAS